MVFNIRMGQPEMATLWMDLSKRKQQGKLDRDEEKLFKNSSRLSAILEQTRSTTVSHRTKSPT